MKREDSMQDDPGLIVFPGPGPFSLPVVQDAKALAGSDGVEMTLYCLIPGNPEPRPIRAQMVHWVAQKLAEQLVTAAIDAEWSGKHS
jgi:hypothetical protein